MGSPEVRTSSIKNSLFLINTVHLNSTYEIACFSRIKMEEYIEYYLFSIFQLEFAPKKYSASRGVISCI